MDDYDQPPSVRYANERVPRRPTGVYYVIQVRPDVLEEHDGPTLRHAIQALHDQRITVPRRVELRPSVESLATRYDRFLEVATAP